MVQYCCVPGCKSSAFTPGISLHILPKNEDVRLAWIDLIGRNEMHKKISENMRVCSLHFLPSDYNLEGLKIRRLKKGAVPTVFPLVSTREKKTSQLLVRSRQSCEAGNERVCELHFLEGDFIREATENDSKNKKTLSCELKVPRLKGVTSLFQGSSNFCPKRRLKNESLAERHHRLKFEKLQHVIRKFLKDNGYSQKDLSSINENFDILVPLVLARSMSEQVPTTAAKVWKIEEVTASIALYQSEKCLYDQTDPGFHHEEERNKAYHRIQTSLASMHWKCSILEIKDKINALLNQYISEKIVKDSVILSGQATEYSYEPQMWCFGLLQFLDEYILQVSTEDNSFEVNSLRNSQKSVSVAELGTNISNSDERDNIFGDYIASEMRYLKENSSLYFKTKQAIIDVLKKAHLSLVNSE